MKRRDFIKSTGSLILLAGTQSMSEVLGDTPAGPVAPTSLGAVSATMVKRPSVAPTNKFYTGNRAPLAPSELIPLPVNSIQPAGWLKVVLERQRDGMCGNLTEISAWLQKDGNAWLSKDGEGKYGWEEVPYWLRGYIELAYVTKDPRLIAESQVWIDGVIGSQRDNGDFGPNILGKNGARNQNLVLHGCSGK